MPASVAMTAFVLPQVASQTDWATPAATMSILAIILPFTLVVIVLGTRAKQKGDRMRLMEKALQAGSLDDETRRVLLDQLSGRNKQRPEWLTTLSQHLVFLSRNAFFVVGWIGLFTGIALWVVGMGFGPEEMGFAGVITALVSFGVVTVPMALREVERRRA